MENIILTANGFENKNIGKMFLKMVNKEPSQLKVVFVPTAAIFASAIDVLPKCLHDLLDLNIPEQNIIVYDLHYKMEYNELIKYDAIYFCGGDPAYLLKRINETGFNEILTKYINNGGIHIGVSAGSIIMANNLQNNLGYLNCKLDVHGNEGIKNGKFKPEEHPHIKLSDNKVIIIKNKEYEVME